MRSGVRDLRLEATAPDAAAADSGARDGAASARTATPPLARRGRTAVFAALAGALALSGCDWFSASKTPLPGERVAVLRDDRDLKPDEAAGRIAVELPRPVANPAWPQAGGFPNSAMQHLETGDTPVIAWSADIGSGSSSDRQLTAPPVVADGKVFVKDARNTVSAYDAQRGTLLWRVELRPEKARDDDEFGGGVAWYAGRLFATTGFAHVFALDPATGKELWRSPVTAPVRGAPTVFADRVFVVGIDNHVSALAAVDGGLLWDFAALQESAGLIGGASPSASGDIVVAPFSSGELIALRADNGRQVWNETLIGPRRVQQSAANLADIRGRPVIDRGRVFAIGNAGQVVSLDLRSGARLWDKAIGGIETPWSAGGFVYVVSNLSEVVCLERETGAVKWVTPLTQFADEKRKQRVDWAGPVLVGDRLLVAGATGELVSLSPYDGKPLGKLDLRDRLRLAPVVADRSIYLLTDSGRLHALR